MDEETPIRKAKRRYDASEKGKARKKRYADKPESKEAKRQTQREWYAEKMRTDPEFAERERERKRIAARERYKRKNNIKTD